MQTLSVDKHYYYLTAQSTAQNKDTVISRKLTVLLRKESNNLESLYID